MLFIILSPPLCDYFFALLLTYKRIDLFILQAYNILSETMHDFAEESMHLNSDIDSIKEAVDAVNIAVEESAKGIVGVTEMASDMTASMESIKAEAEGNREIAGQLKSEVEKFKL